VPIRIVTAKMWVLMKRFMGNLLQDGRKAQI